MAVFVGPVTGHTEWHLSSGVSKTFFDESLAAFAQDVGAGSDKRVVLLLDDAGWHTLPDLVERPACTSELQPAETLWSPVDEPVFDTIADVQAVTAGRCLHLIIQADSVKFRSTSNR